MFKKMFKSKANQDTAFFERKLYDPYAKLLPSGREAYEGEARSLPNTPNLASLSNIPAQQDVRPPFRAMVAKHDREAASELLLQPFPDLLVGLTPPASNRGGTKASMNHQTRILLNITEF
jgi:hypothetical protein